MLTDSKKLFSALIRGKRITKPRLFIEFTAARVPYRNFEISTLSLVTEKDRSASTLCKINKNTALKRIKKAIAHTGVGNGINARRQMMQTRLNMTVADYSELS